MLLLGIAAMQSCQNDVDAEVAQGGLHVTLGNVSSSISKTALTFLK